MKSAYSHDTPKGKPLQKGELVLQVAMNQEPMSASEITAAPWSAGTLNEPLLLPAVPSRCRYRVPSRPDAGLLPTVPNGVLALMGHQLPMANTVLVFL
jgi:hypothetical protein